MDPSDILSSFARNRQQVRDLVNFDTTLTDLVVESLRGLNRRWRDHLAEAHQMSGPTLEQHPLSGGRQLQMFSNIRDHESLKPGFRAIHNLALVALVTFFSSACKGLFRALAEVSFRSGNQSFRTVPLKLTVGDLMNESDIGVVVCNALESSENLTFQDMKSINRAFAVVLGREIRRESHVNDIILAQASRHALVHADGNVDGKMLNQLRDASPRTLKPQLDLGVPLSFSPEEIEQAGEAMATYLASVAASPTTAG